MEGYNVSDTFSKFHTRFLGVNFMFFKGVRSAPKNGEVRNIYHMYPSMS